MSFLAKLTIDDKSYNVLSCSFEVAQQMHHGGGRPSGYPLINHLNIRLESSKDSDFFAWSISPYEQKDGKIVFYKRDAMASARTLEFTGAFCINYSEAFQSNSSNPMETRIVLAVESLGIDNTVYMHLIGDSPNSNN